MSEEKVLNFIDRLGVHVFQTEAIPDMILFYKQELVPRAGQEEIAHLPGKIRAETH